MLTTSWQRRDIHLPRVARLMCAPSEVSRSRHAGSWCPGRRRFATTQGTNVDAAADRSRLDRVVAIVGGYSGGDSLTVGRSRTAGRVAIGSRRCLDALPNVVPVVDAPTLADAVRRAWDLAVPDGVVLLAPACSSFDMFVDYADRGRQFKEEVHKLISE